MYYVTRRALGMIQFFLCNTHVGYPISRKSSATGALLLMIRFACTWKICCRAAAVNPGAAWEDAQDAIDD